MKIGDIIESNNFGKFKILGFEGDKVRYVFLSTGNECLTQRKGVAVGGVVDYSSPEYSAMNGRIINTSNYGKVEVINYISTKNIVVKFFNTGTESRTEKYCLLSGMLVDPVAKAANEAARKTALLEAKKVAQAKLEAATEAKLQKEKQAAEDKLRKKAETKELRRKEREALWEVTKELDSEGNKFVGYTFVDKLGDRYTVVGKVKGKTWIVEYESGNSYEYSEAAIKKNSIYDKNSTCFSDKYKAYSKLQAMLYYDNDRDHRLALAKKYQKNNLERCMLYNRKHRAKKKEMMEGSHTQEELNVLLKEQDNSCACCGEQFTGQSRNRHVDHITPAHLGGTDYISNLRYLCQFCNISKSDKTPEEWDEFIKTDLFRQRRNVRLVKTEVAT